MRCTSCGFENPEGMKFCGQCGTLLKRGCPKCKAENPPDFKFCGECGQPLLEHALPSSPQRGEHTDPSLPGASRAPTRGALEAERRQLTVMFCDVVGSTALSTQLDPEELREVMRAYQHACVTAITRFGGHVAKYLGDGLLVYFGYPVAHEDDAARAVRAGLGIIEAMQALPLPPQVRLPRPLQARIGIHTGLVVVGEMGSGAYREELAIVGETPNLAARLQEKALPNSVVISATTHRLVTGLFECQDLGPQSLKGISQPMPVYRVVQESGLRTRLQVAQLTGLTPLVGRESEVAFLLQRWERAKDGAGQVLLLNGEGGIGKSRLLQALVERVADEPHARLDLRCSPYHQHSALYPVIDLLQRALHFRREDSPQLKLVKLKTAFARYGLTQEPLLALFAALLSLPTPSPLTSMLTPQRQRQKTLEASVEVLLTVAAHQPLLLLVEDLHWIDPSTLELFSLLIAQIPAARILAVFSSRPEFSPPWSPRSHLTVLTLPRLGQAQVEEMAQKVARGKTLPPEVLQHVMSRTDGVPLFVEELTKMVMETGFLTESRDGYELTSPLPPLAIPVTLYDSLMARLDRLSAVKEVAQLGATLGREFTYEFIQAISTLDEATLRQALRRLVEAELLYQTGLPPQATYLFKHALIREAAYQSLLKSTRQRYHQRIAQMLAERFPETAETQPEILAHHAEEAGLTEQAIFYLQKAGQKAIQRSDNVEAIRHLTTGLGLLRALPDTGERAQQELSLQVALGAPLLATKGLAAPEVEAVYARARELCQGLGEAPQVFPLLIGLQVFYTARGALQIGSELAEQCMLLAENVQDRDLLLEAHTYKGGNLFWQGRFTAARSHLEHAIALYDPNRHLSHAFLYGQNPRVVAQSELSWLLWIQGYPDQARKLSQETLALAQEVSHAHSSAFALWFAAFLQGLRGEWQAGQRLAEETIALASEQELPLWLALGTLYRGSALVGQERLHEGVAQMRQGLAAYQATGAGLGQPGNLYELARAQYLAGQVGPGLELLTTALATVNDTGERWYEAELYRLKGILTLQSQTSLKPVSDKSQASQYTPKGNNPQSAIRNPQLAEACFLQAIDIARQQQARSLELRVVTSLSRLWQRQGRRREAHGLLSKIYAWFTEGFDTKDLQEAKMLLEELSR